MSEPDATTRATASHWRNPVFLFVFVSGAVAWLAVVGWLTWLWFNPITDWVGAQNFIVQEIVGTVVWVVWVLFLAFGLGAVGMFAERIAGIRPACGPGQTHGSHATWKRPD